MTDQKICGYLRADGVLCRELGEPDRCTLHGAPLYRVCTGCMGTAVQECSHVLSPGNACRTALCESCAHQLDDTHGPVVEQPFAPPPDMTKPSTPDVDQLVALRLELTEVVKQVLRHAAMDKLISFNPADPASPDKVAAKIMADLPTHVLFKILSAMGGTP